MQSRSTDRTILGDRLRVCATEIALWFTLLILGCSSNCDGALGCSRPWGQLKLELKDHPRLTD
ncbi:hypothetical protein BDQ94DRAFT_19645 [Aspergillus welwitschiae]|uniref:Uncharacterized protein n=1 Tax=Aspergillus welwitschiae TaxID=1341132 RepID=A0A3F3Q6A4_9EURO|nr:hypothetical protein BDQ94DRAFT_19645 [Aspergillus welwitschiae]RDH34452.1 hypothetical protein BDQ94DRAFT_19645 [Aspergillus welwitschiae]